LEPRISPQNTEERRLEELVNQLGQRISLLSASRHQELIHLMRSNIYSDLRRRSMSADEQQDPNKPKGPTLKRPMCGRF